MQIDEKMSRTLADSDEADFVEIRGFHVCTSVDSFRGFSLLSLPSVLQNILWSAQFTGSSRRQMDRLKNLTFYITFNLRSRLPFGPTFIFLKISFL